MRQEGCMMGGIAFGMGGMASDMPDRVDAVFSLSRNIWKGRASLQMEMKAIRPVQSAHMEALKKPDPVMQENALLDALVDAFAQKAGKEPPDTEMIQMDDWAALTNRIQTGERGHLLIARTASSALKALEMAELDVAARGAEDPRGFATAPGSSPAVPRNSFYWS
jgi:hypothetical protein